LRLRDLSSASSHVEAENGEALPLNIYVDTVLAELLEIHQQ